MNKKNLPIIVAISLPIVFVLILAIGAYLPSSKVKLAYDFIYTFESDKYNYKGEYQIKNNKITVVPVPMILEKGQIDYRKDAPNLYYYSRENDTSKIISLDEANKLEFIVGQVSPDGDEIKLANQNFGIGEMFFGDSREPNFIVTNKDGQKKINFSNRNNGEYFYQNPYVLGWIK